MTLRVAVIDPGSGNLASVRRAFERAARDAGVALDLWITEDAQDLARADRIVLPGQGAYAACRRGLEALPGMVEALEEQVHARGKPLLGICVGMQLFAQRGLEFGETPGLAWLPGEVERLRAPGLPLPHMGWNRLRFAPGAHPLLDGIRGGAQVYFVHSYAFTGQDADDVLATTEYGGPVVAMVGRGNLAGTQFHVEKSGVVGLRVLSNFLGWEP